jgi:hypothetical protein
MVGEVAADVHQLLEGPAGAGLAIGAGIFRDGQRFGPALVVGLDLADGLAAGGAGMEDLVQKGQEGEFGREVALATVGARCIGSQEGRVDPIAAESFEVVEGARALQGQGGGLERGVEFAEERSGRKHISVLLQIYT